MNSTVSGNGGRRKENGLLCCRSFFSSSRNCLQATYSVTPQVLLILPSVLLPRVYLEVSLSASCLVSLTVSSQLLLFLELPPQYQFQEAFLDPPALAGSHDVLTFRVYWCVSPKRLKTAYRWKYGSCYCILCTQGKS